MPRKTSSKVAHGTQWQASACTKLEIYSQQECSASSGSGHNVPAGRVDINCEDQRMLEIDIRMRHPGYMQRPEVYTSPDDEHGYLCSAGVEGIFRIRPPRSLLVV